MACEFPRAWSGESRDRVSGWVLSKKLWRIEKKIFEQLRKFMIRIVTLKLNTNGIGAFLCYSYRTNKLRKWVVCFSGAKNLKISRSSFWLKLSIWKSFLFQLKIKYLNFDLFELTRNKLLWSLKYYQIFFSQTWNNHET